MSRILGLLAGTRDPHQFLVAGAKNLGRRTLFHLQAGGVDGRQIFCLPEHHGKLLRLAPGATQLAEFEKHNRPTDDRKQHQQVEDGLDDRTGAGDHFEYSRLGKRLPGSRAQERIFHPVPRLLVTKTAAHPRAADAFGFERLLSTLRFIVAHPPRSRHSPACVWAANRGAGRPNPTPSLD